VLDSTCIFCKIIQGLIPAQVIQENDYVTVIKDIYPKAPIHYLIIPKKHIIDISELTDLDQEFGWEMLKIARAIAKKEILAGFNLISNNGKAAGQSVMHLHFHLLAGKNIYSGGLAL
jgi:histidine triad (HIT) family protein